MKINIYCMDAAGRIVCGLLTSNETTAAAFMQRKQEKGFIIIKKVYNK